MWPKGGSCRRDVGTGTLIVLPELFPGHTARYMGTALSLVHCVWGWGWGFP